MALRFLRRRRIVHADGVDSAAVISRGGQETVYAGGVASHDTLASGGAQYDYGVTSDTTILKGGAANIASGGCDYNAQIDGSEVVSSGGAAYYGLSNQGAHRRSATSPSTRRSCSAGSRLILAGGSCKEP